MPRSIREPLESQPLSGLVLSARPPSLAISLPVALLGDLSGLALLARRCSASAMGAGWIGVSAFVKQAALRPRLQVLRRTRSCRRTAGYCPLWSWHPPLRIEERDGGAK